MTSKRRRILALCILLLATGIPKALGSASTATYELRGTLDRPINGSTDFHGMITYERTPVDLVPNFSLSTHQVDTRLDFGGTTYTFPDPGGSTPTILRFDNRSSSVFYAIIEGGRPMNPADPREATLWLQFFGQDSGAYTTSGDVLPLFDPEKFTSPKLATLRLMDPATPLVQDFYAINLTSVQLVPESSTIDPPSDSVGDPIDTTKGDPGSTPIPEPTSLVVFATVAVGAAWARGRNARRPIAA